MTQISKKGTGIEYEFEILECIRNHPGGLTITDIADLKSYSRNTVSKYVSILELKTLVFSRKIGAYKLYFSSATSFIPKRTVLSYYKAFLAALKEYFPKKEEVFKEIAKNLASKIDFAFGPKVYKQLKSYKGHPISRIHLEVFKDFYPTYDIFQPDIEISILKADPERKKAIYRFKNSIFLEDSDNFIYHIYIASGLTEGVLERELNTRVECNVEEIHVSKKNKQDSYFDISIQIKDEI
ncbi:MAG: helix-turn-helix domain-containing protein [Candidatus Thorarchaeota archaeon]